MDTPLQLTMAVTPAHRNQYLFSDHYLNNLLPQDPRWDAALPEVGVFLAWLQRLYTQEQKQLPKYNESQLEEHWFKPILSQLGHVFEGQAGVPGLNDGVKRPDYVFFPDDGARQAAVGAQRTEEYAADALAVGEVKRWDVPLSKKQKGGGASFEAQNPSWQIDYYVRATGLEWGILSNGRLWRLVYKDTSQRLSIHYEVDLVDLLSRGDAGAVRYFTLFFRQAAFRPDAQGHVFLRDALDSSMAYAVDLEEDLEANVYQALERLMQGFLDLPANGLGADDLRQIYENSLYLLYRLLFILYGETRGLLPMNRDSYRDNYSLDLIKREIAELRTPPVPMTTIYWGRLKQLFQIINGDNVALNRHLGVPRYNGRLFDPEQHPFSERYAVGDRALVEAIDLLSRRTTEAGRESVDYRTLGVRHLGSIYEGLLEYQPRYATEPMIAIRDGKSERWVVEADLERPLGSGKTPRVVDSREAGQVYLQTDRGERKATGSYYTPQYIVEYIVENTLGPLVEEATERVRERTKGVKGKAARAAAEQSLIDEILSLKVLDPAMGSGHFLVEATEYMALALATDPYVETEVSVEEDLLYWKRRVVERCIYGVDKNPLAVELAKLSLWLATVAADKPLSFLDHHLQCGDSLIGARVADLGWSPPVVLSKKAQKQLEQQKAGQMNMFEYLLSQQLPVVMGRILEITEVESDSYETVQAKEATDQAVRELKAPFQAVANLWVSAYFGNEFTQGDYDEAVGLIARRDELLALPAVGQAQEMVDDRDFFHWELAFPEVFYDRHGQPLRDRAGFDAVMGNPPYVDSEEMSRSQPELREYCTDVGHWKAASGNWDLFVVFIELGVRLIRRFGRSGMIVPNKLLGAEYCEAIQGILSELIIESIRDYSRVKVFNANVYPLVYILQSGDPTSDQIISLTEMAEADSGSPMIIRRLNMATGMLSRLPAGYWWPIFSESANTLNKCMLVSDDLCVFAEVLGAATVSEAYQLIDVIEDSLSRKKSQEGYLRLVNTGTIDRYEVLWGLNKTQYIKHIYQYPVVSECVLAEMLSTRYQQAKTPKIILAGMVKQLEACYDELGSILAGKSTVIVLNTGLDLAFLLAVINSELCSFLYREIFGALALQGGYLRVGPPQVEKLPIRRINFTTLAAEREQLVAQAQAFYTAGDHDKLLVFTRDRLAADPDQSDVVHDLLAHLAEQMMAINTQKQAAVEAFWLDLEGVTEAAAFEILRNKGKHERTLWKKAEACRLFVREESHSTRRLDESLSWNEEAFKAFVKILVGRVQGLSDLVGVYRAHSPAYGELVARIEATDWLIDQIVYKLYGLDEDEIAIVEGVES